MALENYLRGLDLESFTCVFVNCFFNDTDNDALFVEPTDKQIFTSFQAC